jgi:phosphopantetheinyl transferase
MIGNDIVDLQAAARESNWRRRGYLQKVFTLEEQQKIKTALEPDLLVWIFWSMKEAAYKAHQRKFDLKRTFSPSKYHCRISQRGENSALGKVSVEGNIYSTETCILKTRVHTIAKASAGIKTFSKIYSASANIKYLILEEISASWGLPQSLLRIEKDRNGVPFLIVREQLTGLPFSLSHHGNFTAFSLPLMKD